MMRTLCAAVLVVAAAAAALEDTPRNRAEQADRYLAATPPKDMFDDAADKMARNLPPEQRQQFKELMTEHLDIEAVTKTMRDAMVKHFTAEELQALADFYGSRVGKSAMKKFGAYMADVTPAILAEVTKAQAKANRALKAGEEAK